MYILHTCLFVLLHSKIHHGKKRTKDMLAGTYSIPDTSLSVTLVLELEGAELICYLIFTNNFNVVALFNTILVCCRIEL